MPVEVEQYEPMIYRSQWLGTLTTAEIERGWMHQSHLALMANDPAYVAIIDLTDNDEVPADVRELGKILTFDAKCIHICFIGVSPAMRMFFDTLGIASRKASEFEIVNKLVDALAKARQILRERGYSLNDDDQTNPFLSL